MRYLRLPLVFVFFVTLSTVAHAQGQNSLQGRVITPDGTQPVNPVRVTLTFNGRRVQETFTDLSGRYLFAGLTKGTYQITAAGDGQTFETTSINADVSAFGGAGQLFTQDIQLRAIRGKSGVVRAGVVNAFAQDVPKAAREKFERAQKYAAEGKSNLVIPQLHEAVRLFPQYFDANLMLGNQLIQASRLDEAIAPLDRAREVNPSDERVYQSFGLLLMRQRKYPIAVAIFAEAARLNPANPLNQMMRSSALIYQASFVSPDNFLERNNLLNQAKLAMAQAAELSQGRMKPDAVTLATYYDLRGEPARAADELEEFLKKNPASKNGEAIKTEIGRLRSKAKGTNTP